MVKKMYSRTFILLAFLALCASFASLGGVAHAQTKDAAMRATPNNCGWVERSNVSIYSGDGYYLGYMILWQNSCTHTGHVQTIQEDGIFNISISTYIYNGCLGKAQTASGNNVSYVNTNSLPWQDGCMFGYGSITDSNFGETGNADTSS